MRAEPRVILLCEVLIVLISSASNAFNCARILELCSDFLRPVYDVISPEFKRFTTFLVDLEEGIGSKLPRPEGRGIQRGLPL